MPKERRWDKIMRLIDEGKTDDEIIDQVIRPGENRESMCIYVYRKAHDGTLCCLAAEGADGQPGEGRRFMPSEGLRRQDGIQHGEMIGRRWAAKHLSDDVFSGGIMSLFKD